ncbi:LysM peptidoglycan-binding domain-containing protein [Litorimonas sp. WD9-15]|uniref:LysM peptidoglycan-binding domain-containing protein n=1 Tax=Litorimonas sp. WD9-15 TaxID=3418716 RepID=UPI003D03B893
MRAKILLSAAAFTLMATPAFAQSSYNVVVEPVAPTVQDIINAPVEYDENGVVKAQYFKADDLSEAEYQALLEEADRIRAYQAANGTETVIVDVPQSTTTYDAPSSYGYESTDTYQVELYSSEPATSAPTTAKIHTVAKGDTLYNISKRYDAKIADIKSENGLNSNALSIGQQIRIPGVVSSSLNSTIVQPIFASTPTRDGVVTRRVVQNAPMIVKPVINSGTQVYAVLPKDTLYSISRRTCVGVKDLIATNGITNPNALTPGQRLNLPAGHCLAK